MKYSISVTAAFPLFQLRMTFLNYFRVRSFSDHGGKEGASRLMTCSNTRWATKVGCEAPILKNVHMAKTICPGERSHWPYLEISDSVMMLQNAHRFQVNFTWGETLLWSSLEARGRPHPKVSLRPLRLPSAPSQALGSLGLVAFRTMAVHLVHVVICLLPVSLLDYELHVNRHHVCCSVLHLTCNA